MLNVDNLARERYTGSEWRILPVDALPSEKHVAEMMFDCFDSKMFPGHTVAHGRIYNDSRGIFEDGDPVRTSTVKNVLQIADTVYIETRNTMYKVINKERLLKCIDNG